MVPVSVVIGCAVWVACAATLELAQAGHAEVPVALVLDSSLVVLDLLRLAPVAVIALRAHTAPADELRRVVLFSSGFLMQVGVIAAYDAAEVFSPGHWVSNHRWSPTVLVMDLMRFPGMVLLWYSVLAVRVPPLREVVWTCYRRLLMRPGLLAAAAAPAVALGWLVVSSPEQQVGAVIADPLAQSLLAVAGIMLLLVVVRKRILLRLDAWVHPETTDQRQVLAAATSVLAKAERMTTISRTVTRTVERGCGSPATLLVAARSDTDEHDFWAPDSRIAPLARASAIVHMLETDGRSLRVHPTDVRSVFVLLPPDEARWVAASAADVLVAVPGPGADVVGILVVGRRSDERIVSSVDVPFLEVLASTAGLAVARLRLLQGPGGRLSEAPPAQECPRCRCVTAAREPPGCDCGTAYVETEVPRMLAGKFRLTRRRGTGGMGSVYLARDVGLERDVARQDPGRSVGAAADGAEA